MSSKENDRVHFSRMTTFLIERKLNVHQPQGLQNGLQEVKYHPKVDRATIEELIRCCGIISVVGNLSDILEVNHITNISKSNDRQVFG